MFKILVVEDDKELNHTVCSFLNQSGYEAVGCLNANEAYDALYGGMFDLIVSDIMSTPFSAAYSTASRRSGSSSGKPRLTLRMRQEYLSTAARIAFAASAALTRFATPDG